MRECLKTKTKFNPSTEEHYFADMEAFEAFINQVDPMDEFQPTKREIKWGPFHRHCSSCGESYTTEHPAQMYCDNCSPQEKTPVERKSPLEYYQQHNPKHKECEKCGNLFEAALPAMRYCEDCSERGGRVVEKT